MIYREPSSSKKRKVRRKLVTPVVSTAERRAASRSTRKSTPKPKPATRTRTEIGQTVAPTKKAERAKSKALKARKAAKQYSRTLEREQERKARQAIRRQTRANKRVGRDDPERARGLKEGERELQRFVAGARGKETYKPSKDPIKDELAKMAPTGLKVVRAITGDRPGQTTPSLGEVAEVAATIASGGAGKGVSVASKALKAKSATRVAEAAKVAERGRKARKAETTAEKAQAVTRLRKARATGHGMRRGAKSRLGKVERRARRTKRQDRALRAATNPAVVTTATNPNDVGDRAKAFAVGTATANPVKSAKTTARAIPALLGFGATVAGDAYRSAKTGSLRPLEGAGKMALESVKALEPLVSGDADKVREATEEDIGYIFAPLVPRALSSRAGRAVGKGAKKVAVKARVPQQITERGTRKRIAKDFAREVQRESFVSGRARREIDKPARKVKGARSARNVKGFDAADVAPALARYGISRKSAKSQLDHVVRTLDGKDAGEVLNVRRVKEYVDAHPEVLRDKNLWKTVDAIKRRSEEVTTSRRAKYLAQARVVDDKILKPEERVPVAARPLTRAKTRGEAWKDLEKRRKAVAKAKGDARAFARAAQATKGAESKGLRTQAAASRNAARQIETEAKALHKELKKFSKGDRDPTIRARRKHWDRRLVDEFVNEVKVAAKREGFEEPAWLAERTRPTEGEIAPKFNASASRAVNIKTGKSELHDIADRSLRETFRSTVHAPRIQRALHRTVRKFLTDEAIPKTINGNARKIITGEEASLLREQGQFDPTREVLLPSRQYNQALKSDKFDPDNLTADSDLSALHANLVDRLKTESAGMEPAPGTKYVVVRREAAREFADQINPEGGMLEKTLTGVGLAGTRTILGLSPAWLMAQVAAEGLQTAVSVAGNPLRAAKAVRAIQKLKKTDPQGYEAFAGLAGESVAAFDMPGSLRVSMDGGTQGRYYNASRAIRKTPVGRALLDAASVKTLGLFDRWKSGKYRSVILAAKADKELNGFMRGLQGMMHQQDAISKKLKGKPLHEQLSYLAKNPAELGKHLDYLDDVMGNWQAFTRFERAFAPALVFYPFVRMSLRWTFWSYPKAHPVKAQLLYQLSQQNAEELENLLGVKPDFRGYAQTVIHGEEAEADAVLPAGGRFASPGTNVLLESIGEDNVAGLIRGLNPVISSALFGATGLSPFTGEQDKWVPRGLHVLNQLLSLAAPARALELNRLGLDDTAARQAFKNIDPNREERSLALPFLPLSGERARMGAQLSEKFEKSAQKPDSEIGQFARMVDKYGLREASRRLREGVAASDDLRESLPSSGDELINGHTFDEISKIFYKIKFGGDDEKESSGTAYHETFGSNRSRPTRRRSTGGAYNEVFGR